MPSHSTLKHPSQHSCCCPVSWAPPHNQLQQPWQALAGSNDEGRSCLALNHPGRRWRPRGSVCCAGRRTCGLPRRPRTDFRLVVQAREARRRGQGLCLTQTASAHQPLRSLSRPDRLQEVGAPSNSGLSTCRPACSGNPEAAGRREPRAGEGWPGFSTHQGR